MNVGCDIIEIARIEKVYAEYGTTFLSKILTEKEREHFHLKKKGEVLFLAGRFSAKEAVAKALGTGFGEHLHFHDIEIFNKESGQPYVLLSKEAMLFFHNPTLHLSISHCKAYAMAVCMIL